MQQSAGRASFPIPEDWVDRSTYAYSSPDSELRISMFFDPGIETEDIDALLADRLATISDALPGFELVSAPAALVIGRFRSRVVTFDSQDMLGKTRSRLLVVLLKSGLALIVTAQATSDRWSRLEMEWTALVAGLTVADV